MVFLIDGSEGVRSGFPLLKEFVQRVVESLDVGPDRVRVAVVQYSDRTRPEFYLNSYMDQQSVVSAVRRLTLLGGPTPNTGAALDFVLRNILISSAGSRIAEGVPQLLIVLTADRSGDDVRGPSVVVKRGGAVPIGIGIGNADITEMQTISFIPDFAVAIPTFRQLGTVQQVISDRVIQLNREELSRLQPVLLPPTSPGKEGSPWVLVPRNLRSYLFGLWALKCSLLVFSTICGENWPSMKNKWPCAFGLSGQKWRGSGDMLRFMLWAKLKFQRGAYARLLCRPLRLRRGFCIISEGMGPSHRWHQLKISSKLPLQVQLPAFCDQGGNSATGSPKLGHSL